MNKDGSVYIKGLNTQIQDLLDENVFLGAKKEEFAAYSKEVKDALPDKKKVEDGNEALIESFEIGKSILTHDYHLEELLKPVAKAFSGDKEAPPLVVAPDNRNQSVTKLGDTYSGGISSRIQDNTAMMLAYTKNLDSTTGQFA